MSRKKKKSIWRSTFYRVYFALVALALVAIAIGTMWLRNVLRDYESAQPKYVAEDVGQLFKNADYDAIYNYDTSATQFEGGDKALYVDGLKAHGSRITHSTNGAHIGLFVDGGNATFSNITMKLPA